MKIVKAILIGIFFVIMITIKTGCQIWEEFSWDSVVFWHSAWGDIYINRDIYIAKIFKENNIVLNW